MSDTYPLSRWASKLRKAAEKCLISSIEKRLAWSTVAEDDFAIDIFSGVPASVRLAFS